MTISVTVQPKMLHVDVDIFTTPAPLYYYHSLEHIACTHVQFYSSHRPLTERHGRVQGNLYKALASLPDLDKLHTYRTNTFA